jgi:soluble lytic murein transglycosylase-like protein
MNCRLGSRVAFVLTVVVTSIALISPTRINASESVEMRRLTNDARSLANMIQRINRGPTAAHSKMTVPQTAPAATTPYTQIIHAASERYRLPPALIAGVIKCESNWKATAVSKAGARGLMQILPHTARSEFQIDPEELWDPKINVNTGSAYLRILANRYNGDSATTVAAYNAGPGRVDSGRRLPAETLRYQDCVRRWFNVYKRGRQ